MNKFFSFGVGTLFMTLPLLTLGGETLPEAGIRAEVNGQWDEAVKVYQQALGTDPTQAHLWLRIADIQVKRGDLHAAADALDKAARYAPENPTVYVKLSEVRAALGDPKGAALALEQASLLTPNDGKLFLHLSQAYATAQEAKPALAAINRAIEIEPNNVEYLRARGVLAVWNGDYATATDSYHRVMALAPGDKEAWLGMARSGMQLGDKDKAAQNYRDYLAEYPQNKEAMAEYIELEAERGNVPVIKEYGALYRERFGEDLNYWLRMADNYALAGDDRASAEALEQATRFAENDPGLFYRLSQSYPSLEDVNHATAAIKRAVELNPKNLEYLRSQADLAAWSSDYATALDSYNRILKIAPDDPGAMLGIARLQAWKGEIDASAKQYKAYLDKNPQVQLVWIEYIEVQTERGDYALAMELLEQYRERFGDNAAYRKQKARTLAWADRPTPSLSIVSDLEPTMKDDYELGYTRTVALAYAHRPSDALKSLAEVVKLVPESRETVDLQRYIKTPLRSNINFSFGSQYSSDHISIKHVGVDGEYVITPETRIFGGVDKQWLHAEIGSGFEKVNGSQDLGYQRDWIGVRHRVSPKVSLDAQIGAGNADGQGNLIYEIGADLQPKDELSMRVSRRQDLFAVSPLAADLGILRRANTLALSWMPNLRYTVDGQLGYDTISDGNNRWELDVAPRRAFMRTQRFNLDLGVAARWFGFQKNLDHGYYSPNTYERYSLNAYGYWKISDDDGVSVTASVGPWKDNTTSNYRTGGDLVVEGFFGLYRDWMLDVRGSLSHYGGADAASAGTGGGSFRSTLFELILTKRF